MVVLFFLLQIDPPTVGDTIWLSRKVRVPDGYEVRAAEWQPEGSVEVLGRPRVVREGNQATIAYPAVAWDPGAHLVAIPGPVLLTPNGSFDSLPLETVTIEIASVLPPARPDSSPPIQPAIGVVPRAQTSPWPLVLLWSLAALLWAAARAFWRRRGSPTPVEAATEVLALGPQVQRWAAAGESRAVAALAAAELRDAIAARVRAAHPALHAGACLEALAEDEAGWPLAEIGRLLKELEAARFAPLVAHDAEALYARASALAHALRAE